VRTQQSAITFNNHPHLSAYPGYVRRQTLDLSKSTTDLPTFACDRPPTVETQTGQFWPATIHFRRRSKCRSSTGTPWSPRAVLCSRMG